jgi:hypothetical protein
MIWVPGGWWIFLLIALFFWGPWRWGRRMRRWEQDRYGPSRHSLPRPPELDESVKARLDLVDQLETRVSELENRLDFTERLLAERQATKG